MRLSRRMGDLCVPVLFSAGKTGQPLGDQVHVGEPPGLHTHRSVEVAELLQPIQVISAKKVADHSLDIGVAGSGSPTFRLVVRDSRGMRREATVRFDVAIIGKDTDSVDWKNA